VTVAEPVKDVFNGQEVEVWPRVTWSPKWALIFKDVKDKVNDKCSITQRSALVINGSEVSLDGLNLDGTLIINAADGAQVVLLNNQYYPLLFIPNIFVFINVIFALFIHYICYHFIFIFIFIVFVSFIVFVFLNQ
jgi:hypothetical protein